MRCPRPKQVEPRRVIFIWVEGKSDRAFVKFLKRCCDDKGLHLNLLIKSGHGGDSVVAVEGAARELKNLSEKDISNSLVLLDQDRFEQDRLAGRDAWAVASRSGLEIIFQKPNLEGLLFRLYEGRESRQIKPGDSMRELKKVWPEYRKASLNADQLARRFSVSDVQRAAQYDKGLRRLLDVLGL